MPALRRAMSFAAVTFIALAMAVQTANCEVVGTTASAQFRATELTPNAHASTNPIPGKLLWSASFPNHTVSQPVVKNGVTLFAVSTPFRYNSNPVHATVYCMTVRGVKLWEYALNAVPTRLDVVVTDDHSSSALFANGTKKTVSGTESSKVAVVSWPEPSSEVLAVVDLRTGKELWRKSFVYSIMAYTATSTMIYVGDDSRLKAMHIRTGSVAWDNYINTPFVVVRNNILYASDYRSGGGVALLARDPLSGVLLWQSEGSGLNNGYTPVVADNGRIYTYSSTNVTAVRASDGTVEWNKPTFGIVSELAVRGDLLFVTHEDWGGPSHGLIVMNAVTGQPIANKTSTYTRLSGHGGNDQFFAVKENSMWRVGGVANTTKFSPTPSPYPGNGRRYGPSSVTYASEMLYIETGNDSGNSGVYNFHPIIVAMNASTGSVKWSANATACGCGSFGRAGDIPEGIMWVTCKQSSEITAMQLPQ